jgi:hypothetical protein
MNNGLVATIFEERKIMQGREGKAVAETEPGALLCLLFPALFFSPQR